MTDLFEQSDSPYGIYAIRILFDLLRFDAYFVEVTRTIMMSTDMSAFTFFRGDAYVLNSIYYQPELIRGEYWRLKVVLLQYFFLSIIMQAYYNCIELNIVG